MSDILLQLKITKEQHDRVRLVMERIQRAHDEEMDTLADQIKAGGKNKATEKLAQKWDDLHERGRRITPLNVVRMAIDEGLEGVKVESALKWISEEGVPLGRPRRIAG